MECVTSELEMPLDFSAGGPELNEAGRFSYAAVVLSTIMSSPVPLPVPIPDVIKLEVISKWMRYTIRKRD